MCIGGIRKIKNDDGFLKFANTTLEAIFNTKSTQQLEEGLYINLYRYGFDSWRLDVIQMLKLLFELFYHEFELWFVKIPLWFSF